MGNADGAFPMGKQDTDTMTSISSTKMNVNIASDTKNQRGATLPIPVEVEHFHVVSQGLNKESSLAAYGPSLDMATENNLELSCLKPMIGFCLAL